MMSPANLRNLVSETKDAGLLELHGHVCLVFTSCPGCRVFLFFYKVSFQLSS